MQCSLGEVVRSGRGRLVAGGRLEEDASESRLKVLRLDSKEESLRDLKGLPRMC